MTDNDIIKVLECCHKGNLCRSDCPYDSEDDSCIECTSKLAKDTLNLINRQKEQIDRLINVQETLQKYISEQEAEIEEHRKIAEKVVVLVQEVKQEYAESIAKARAEAITEFKKLTYEACAKYGQKDKFNKAVFLNIVDQIAKETKEKLN